METVITNPQNLSTELKIVAKETGVGDLPLPVRGPFAKALIAERRGDRALAESELQRAIAAAE